MKLVEGDDHKVSLPGDYKVVLRTTTVIGGDDPGIQTYGELIKDEAVQHRVVLAGDCRTLALATLLDKSLYPYGETDSRKAGRLAAILLSDL